MFSAMLSVGTRRSVMPLLQTLITMQVHFHCTSYVAFGAITSIAGMVPGPKAISRASFAKPSTHPGSFLPSADLEGRKIRSSETTSSHVFILVSGAAGARQWIPICLEFRSNTLNAPS
jgi:hypothetical protein